MPEFSLLATGLAFLVPFGYALIAVGGLPEPRARQAALGSLAALGFSVLGYAAIGFGLQYGGIGLVHTLPGLEELVWEWSALGETWGTGWGMAGLAGWGLSGPAATPGAYALALSTLPWLLTAAMVPLVSLRGRIPAWASALVGLLVGALIYPLVGNWILGGGWLANLGTNLGLGHGFVDAGGAGQVHLLGAAVAAAGMFVFLSRKPRKPDAGEPVPLPPVHLPLLAVLGAGFLLAGTPSWILASPLLARTNIDPFRMSLNLVLAAAAGGLAPLAYTWFVTGTPDPLMAARGLAAAVVAAAAIAPFVPPWAVVAVGAGIGILVPLTIYVVDHGLRWDDPTAALTVHGLAASLGLLCLGILADGAAGSGWNGVGAGAYLGVTGQGVAGWLAASGFRADFPGQLQAQLIGALALALAGFFGAWILLAPLSLLGRALQPRQAAVHTVSLTDPPPVTESWADQPVLESAASEPPLATATGQPDMTENPGLVAP